MSGSSPTNRRGTRASAAKRPARRPSGSSPTRARRTRSQVQDLEAALYAIVQEIQPCTVRQVFYQAVSRGLVEKTERAYKNSVGRLLTRMRLGGTMPSSWIVDHTRWVHQAEQYGGLDELRRDMLAAYRRDLWRDQPERVEIWIEKQALVGVVYEATDEWGVPLYPCRGYPSVTYLAEAAAAIRRCGKPTYVYYLGDYDPSGLDIPRVVERHLREMAPKASIHFERVAVCEAQISEMCLPTRPTKRTDSRSRSFEGESVELDAIPPDDLRAIVRSCIERHLDQDRLERTQRIEELERQSLASLRMPRVALDGDAAP